MGFTMSPEEAAALIRRDARNAEVLFPYLNAEDLCSRPDASPGRWVINFFNWPLERAKFFPELFDRVEKNVRPERLLKKGSYRKYWWQYGRRGERLYETISGRKLQHVIVMPLVSKLVLPLMYPTGIVFSHKLAVIARDNGALLGVLSSNVHRHWVRLYSSTLGIGTNYSPTDCFETFPFPPRTSTIESIVKRLSEIRSKITLDQHLGLTKLYNRVNDQGDADARIQLIRDLHLELDRAVCDAYGWSDLGLAYGFYETDEGTRWTIGEAARNEILDRLLELNHERHREEDERGGVDTSASTNGKRTRARKPFPNRGSQMELAKNDGN